MKIDPGNGKLEEVYLVSGQDIFLAGGVFDHPRFNMRSLEETIQALIWSLLGLVLGNPTAMATRRHEA